MKSINGLTVVVFGFAAFNALGAWQGWERWRYLRQLPLSLPPAYLIGRDAVWALAFGVLAAGLARRMAWSRIGTMAALPLYFAQGWVERLWLGRSEFAQVPLGWAAALTLFWIGLASIILGRPGARRWFR